MKQIKMTKKDYLDIIPNNILNSNLRESTKVLLGCLINAENTFSEHNEEKGYFHISNTTLGKLTNYSKTTIVKELGCMSNKELLNFISRKSGEAHKQSQYKINWTVVNNFSLPQTLPLSLPQSLPQNELKINDLNNNKNNTSLPLTLSQSLPHSIIEYSIIENRNKEYNNINKNNINNIIKEKENNNKLLKEKEEMKEQEIMITLTKDNFEIVGNYNSINFEELEKIYKKLNSIIENNKMTGSTNLEVEPSIKEKENETPTLLNEVGEIKENDIIPINEEKIIETSTAFKSVEENNNKINSIDDKNASGTLKTQTTIELVNEDKEIDSNQVSSVNKEILTSTEETKEISSSICVENSPIPTKKELHDKAFDDLSILCKKMINCSTYEDLIDKKEKLKNWWDELTKKGNVDKNDEINFQIKLSKTLTSWKEKNDVKSVENYNSMELFNEDKEIVSNQVSSPNIGLFGGRTYDELINELELAPIYDMNYELYTKKEEDDIINNVINKYKGTYNTSVYDTVDDFVF